MGVRLRGWGVAVPERIVTNDELSATLDTSDEWIFERTGIHERRVGGPTSELAIAAARRALDAAGVTAESVDVLVLATTTPDNVVPATAPSVAAALGSNAAAFDLNAACSGFMYAMVVAQGLCNTVAQRVLVVGAEELSRWTDWNDRTMAVLLGDGAGAVVMDAVEGPGDILGTDMGSDGTLKELLICPHGGTIWMEGKEVFRRAVRIMVDSSERALARAGVTMDDIALVVPHQANVRIINAACQRLGVEESRAVVVLDRYGNTSSASIPLAVNDAILNDRVHPGDLVLMTGFGGGMTWASAVVRWPS